MTTWAIIPVKSLRESKRRLERLLSADERADLIFHFLDDLLITLMQVREIDRILIVTGDPAVAALAEQRGLDLLVEPSPVGLNAAVALGAAHAAEAGATAALILPADLPFARFSDIEQMLRPLDRLDPPLLAICADEAETGTNALLLAPPGGFTFRYGPGSFYAHLAEARAGGREIVVVQASGLRFDLDTESDWYAYNGYLLGIGEE